MLTLAGVASATARYAHCLLRAARGAWARDWGRSGEADRGARGRGGRAPTRSHGAAAAEALAGAAWGVRTVLSRSTWRSATGCPVLRCGLGSASCSTTTEDASWASRRGGGVMAGGGSHDVDNNVCDNTAAHAHAHAHAPIAETCCALIPSTLPRAHPSSSTHHHRSTRRRA